MAASTNRARTGVVRQSARGVVPTTPAYLLLRHTANAMDPNLETVKSEEIRSDRRTTGSFVVSKSGGGTISAEVSFEGQRQFLESSLMGTFVAAPVTAAGGISAVSATALTVASGGASFKVGQLALMQGLPTAANNKLARVASSTGTSITFPAATFAAETASIPAAASARVVGFEGAANDITATTTGGPALLSTALDFTSLPLQVGQTVLVGDRDNLANAFATAACNGFCRISAIAPNRLSFNKVPAGFATDAGSGKSIRVFAGDLVKDGSTEHYYTIERAQLDAGTVQYETFSDQFVNTATIEANVKRVVTSQFGLIGPAPQTGTSPIAGSTYTAATNFPVLTAVNVGRVGIAGSPQNGPSFVQSITAEISNNAESQFGLGSDTVVDNMVGSLTIGGRLEVLFGDLTLHEAALSNTLLSLDYKMGRSDGNREALFFDFPAIRLTNINSPVSGRNQARKVQAQWDAEIDGTLGCMAMLNVFFYLPAIH